MMIKQHRGRLKEEEFQRKLREMFNEEAKKRIPVAQRLPWTTDEPECLVKPPVKEPSEPIDILLHSDLRAAERAEFDQYVCEKQYFFLPPSSSSFSSAIFNSVCRSRKEWS